MLQHLLVLTDDLAATQAFYCDTLGFEEVDRPPLPFDGVWLGLDGDAWVHVAERRSYEAWAPAIGLTPPAGPVDHVAFSRESGYEQLAAHEGAIPNEVPGAFRQLFFTDPNGLRVELNFPLRSQ